MESHDVRSIPVRTGWSTVLIQAAAAALLFEVASGLAITFGPFRPVIEWNLLLHTLVGLVAVTPFALYLIRHWKDYVGQTLSDVLLLGYVAGGAQGSGDRGFDTVEGKRRFSEFQNRCKCFRIKRSPICGRVVQM
jgi:hypothetical protein